MKYIYNMFGKRCIIITLFWDGADSFFVYKSYSKITEKTSYNIVAVEEIRDGFVNKYWFKSKQQFNKYQKGVEK